LLVSEAPPIKEKAGKSMVLAILLAFVFGPVGLLYVRAWWVAFLVVAVAVPFYVTGKLTWIFSIASRLFCAFWAYHVFTEHEKEQSGQPDVSDLLNRAARLEVIDFEKAINPKT
jgi:hypothetical protein